MRAQHQVLAFVCLLLLPSAVFAAGKEKPAGPPSEIGDFFPYFAEAATKRAYNEWLDANSERTIGKITCNMAPAMTTFYCRGEKARDDFFCAASSKFDWKALRKLQESELPGLVLHATKDLTILCEGATWFCEQKAGEARQCWSRRAYADKDPLGPSTRPTAILKSCAEDKRARYLIDNYVPGETLTERLSYLKDGKQRPTAIFIRSLCRYLANAPQPAVGEEEF